MSTEKHDIKGRLLVVDDKLSIGALMLNWLNREGCTMCGTSLVSARCS